MYDATYSFDRGMFSSVDVDYGLRNSRNDGAKGNCVPLHSVDRRMTVAVEPTGHNWSITNPRPVFGPVS